MADIRVYELAKQLGLDNKTVKQILKDNGIEVKSHMSSVTEEGISIVKKAIGNTGASEEKREEQSKKKPEKSEKKEE